MKALLAGLQVWFYRYFIGYGQYRYVRRGPYYRSRGAPARSSMSPRPVQTALLVEGSTNRRPSRDVA